MYKIGSIPACAGEPPDALLDGWRCPVYPRVCGGTDVRRRRRPTATGLSPRVRGNLHRKRPRLPDHRSIPACAGEPRRRRPCT